MRKKETAVWFYPEIDEEDDVDAKQYHRASFLTRNSALNTSLRKPIRMQDFIQLCDSETDFTFTFIKSVFLDSSITKNNFHLSDKEQLVLYYYASRLALKKLVLIGSLEPL